MFRKMMELTLEEDKEIIENIYPEYQQGFMNARFDKQVVAAPDIHMKDGVNALRVLWFLR